MDPDPYPNVMDLLSTFPPSWVSLIKLGPRDGRKRMYLVICERLVWNTLFFLIEILSIKGTVSPDFLLLVFFMNQFPPSPRVSH